MTDSAVPAQGLVQACASFAIRPSLVRSCMLAALALGTAVSVAAAAPGDKLFDAARPLQIADQGVLYVPGQYVEDKGEVLMMGQMAVQYQVPAKRSRRYPLVMIHGGGQTGTNFLGTPDGRRGWSDYFVSRGYTVYVADQVGRGRSGYYTSSYGTTRRPNVAAMEKRFALSKQYMEWPQAAQHTQWPGNGGRGDPVFDEFFASQVEDMRDLTRLEQLNAAALVKLLERIGPAVLLTHSQSGPIGWLAANARPDLVKGILAVEPSGPPVVDATLATHGDQATPPADMPATRAWGLTRSPMTFDPPAAQVSDMRYETQARADGPNLVRCTLQAEPARQMVRLRGIPLLMVMSESSYHTPYDHCTSKFLTQAGVKHDFMYLPDQGVKGNGHMMFLEKNNLRIASLIEAWERRNVR